MWKADWEGFPNGLKLWLLSESSSAGEAGGNSRRKPGGENCSSAPEHGWVSALINPHSVVKSQHSTAGPESGAVGPRWLPQLSWSPHLPFAFLPFPCLASC